MRTLYALTDVDAVFAWTKGGYNVGRFFGFYPVHIRVREAVSEDGSDSSME